MSDLPDHCKSSAPGISGSGRSGQVITPTGYLIVPVPSGFVASFDYATSIEATDFSFLRFSVQHDGVGPQRVSLYVDVDGAPTYVCVATFHFEKSITKEFNLAGGWCPTKVYGYRINVWNSNYITRAVSLHASVAETPI